jgi:hypothetical protein
MRNYVKFAAMAAVVGTIAIVACNKKGDDAPSPSERAQQTFKGADVTVQMGTNIPQKADITVVKDGNNFKITGTTDTVAALSAPISFDLTTGAVKDTAYTESADREGCKGSASTQRVDFNITNQKINVQGMGDITFSGYGYYYYSSGSINGSAISGENFYLRLNGGQIPSLGGATLIIEVQWNKFTGTVPDACDE